MIGKEFFALEKQGEIFSLELKASVHGFKRLDVLTCRYSTSPMDGMICILERDDCGKWPMPYDLAGPEIANGARLIGQALCLHRDLDI